MGPRVPILPGEWGPAGRMGTRVPNNRENGLWIYVQRCTTTRSILHRIYASRNQSTRRMQRIVGERERGTVHVGCIRLLPPEINWAHRLVAVLSF